MNTDCLSNIIEFIAPKQKRQLTKEFTRTCLPKVVTITGFKQLGEFNRWCSMFDTQNLEEVRFVMRETKLMESLNTDFPGAAREDGLVTDDSIGWVPPSVKKVVFNFGYDVLSRIVISDGVEEVLFESHLRCSSYTFPDSVRKIHFMKSFNNAIGRWPVALEEVIIEGWCSGNGRTPVPIFNLPDTVKHLTIGAHLDVEIMHLPESLVSIVIVGEPERFGWRIEDFGVPDWIEVTVRPSPDEEEFDDYEDPRVEFWNL
jgi:hypothetical protein